MISKQTLYIGVLVATVCIPFPHMAAPYWSVVVVDQSNYPLPGILVRESSQDYSVETVGNESDLWSNEEGRVRFPPRIIYVSLIHRFAGSFFEGISGGVHASFGPHAYVLAFGEGLESGYDGSNWSGGSRKIDSRIVMHSKAPVRK